MNLYDLLKVIICMLYREKPGIFDSILSTYELQDFVIFGLVLLVHCKILIIMISKTELCTLMAQLVEYRILN